MPRQTHLNDVQTERHGLGSRPVSDLRLPEADLICVAVRPHAQQALDTATCKPEGREESTVALASTAGLRCLSRNAPAAAPDAIRDETDSSA